MTKLAMIILFMLMSCGKVQNGKDGINGVDGQNGVDGTNGMNYYSYTVPVNLQEIIGDGHDELITIDEAKVYQFPKSFNVTVDNQYPDCALQDSELIIETTNDKYLFVFQAAENRYEMKLKSGPVNLVVDSPTLKVYYQKVPEVDCGDVVYRLHSGVSFEVRVIQRLEIE